MTTYFKATRPDGTDFHTGTVHYRVGESLPELRERALYRCCSPSVYHASDEAARTLVGGWWPCRLFEVAGDPVAQEGRKFGFRTLHVVREIEAWRALGPNGQQTAAFLESLKSYTDWDDAAQNASTYLPWYIAWTTANGAGRYTALIAAENAAHDAWSSFRYATRSAARYAAGAYVVRDLISTEYFEELTAGFGGVAVGMASGD